MEQCSTVSPSFLSTSKFPSHNWDIPNDATTLTSKSRLKNSYFEVLDLPSELSLNSNQIRWFYREPDKFWQPFCGGDSLRLEHFLSIYSRSSQDEIFVPVLGGMYQVELSVCMMRPLYWQKSSKNISVIRSWWFEVVGDSWLPFDETNNSILDVNHAAVIQSERIDKLVHKDSKVKVQIGDSDIVWHSSSDIRRLKLDLTSKILGFKGNPVKRGYKTLADICDDFAPIGHIVFVLHGVGQAMESASIVKCADSIRDISNCLCQKYFPTKSKTSRVEFIPVNWRTPLILDKGFVSKITLTDAKGLRNMINLSVGDVLYYTSAKFGPEILDSLMLQLNEIYVKFIGNNPDFISRGKISVLAHSLGSVVMYDALFSCRQNFEEATSSHAKLSEIEEEIIHLEKRLKVLRSRMIGNTTENHLSTLYHEPKCSSKKLPFSVEHFFAIGSPISVFLTLRNLDKYIDRSKNSTLSFFPYDVCKRFYNIFHPADPVTYRIEPIISHIYSRIRPITIESASSKPSKEASLIAMGPYIPKQSENKSSTFFSKIMPKFSSNSQQNSIESTENSAYLSDGAISFDEKLIERFDFALKEGMFESSHLNFLTAHTCYWDSKDTILFILLQIYNFIGRPS